MEQQDIVHIALENLLKNTGITGKWKDNVRNKKDKETDGIIDLKIDNNKYTLYTEVKTELRNYQLPQIEKIAKLYSPFLIVAERIFPTTKEALRINNINYLEGNGNIFLKSEDVYVWIDNEKPVPKTKVKVINAFTKTGLKIILQFLLDNTLVNLPYRQIAAITDTSIANINYVINGLMNGGFLIKIDKRTFNLINKKELLEKWMVAYEERLKPKMLIGRFHFLKEEDFKNWKNLSLKTDESYWGGEPGGNLLTNHLKPELLTVYTTQSRADLIKKYRLVPDEKGNLEIYRKFWNDNHVNWNIAPPILVYADLMNTGDRRCIETAQKVYNEYIQAKL